MRRLSIWLSSKAEMFCDPSMLQIFLNSAWTEVKYNWQAKLQTKFWKLTHFLFLCVSLDRKTENVSVFIKPKMRTHKPQSSSNMQIEKILHELRTTSIGYQAFTFSFRVVIVISPTKVRVVHRIQCEWVESFFAYGSLVAANIQTLGTLLSFYTLKKNPTPNFTSLGLSWLSGTMRLSMFGPLLLAVVIFCHNLIIKMYVRPKPISSNLT